MYRMGDNSFLGNRIFKVSFKKQEILYEFSKPLYFDINFNMLVTSGASKFLEAHVIRCYLRQILSVWRLLTGRIRKNEFIEQFNIKY